jgi:hypothetical protein
MPTAAEVIAQANLGRRKRAIWINHLPPERQKWFQDLRKHYREQIAIGVEVNIVFLFDTLQANPQTRVPVARTTFAKWLTSQDN